jgi:hypothetical protein
MNAATFSLAGTPASLAEPALLGLWEATPGQPDAELSFAPGTAPPAGPVWRVDLPAEPGQAVASLNQAERRVRLADRALSSAQDRLVAFAASADAGASFAVTTGAGTDTAEQELAALLQREPADESSFVPGFNTIRRRWEDVADWFSSIIDSVLTSVVRLATVETAIESVSIARSNFGWTGDCATVCRRGFEAKHVHLHRRTVAIVLASRLALIRTLILALRAAGIVAVALGSPTGALLALPAVWKFITRVQDEFVATRQEA